MFQVSALLHQLSVLLARDPDVRLQKVVSKFIQPLVTICVATLSDANDVTTTLKTVVFVSTLFRFVAKIHDAQTTQAVVVALQHILLVCPELREAALGLKVPTNSLSALMGLHQLPGV